MLTVQVIAFIAGSVFILIAIIGGGFTVKELKIPTVPKTGRIISGIVGALFISISLLMVVVPSLPTGRSPGERSPNASTPHRDEAAVISGPYSSLDCGASLRQVARSARAAASNLSQNSAAAAALAASRTGCSRWSTRPEVRVVPSSGRIIRLRSIAWLRSLA